MTKQEVLDSLKKFSKQLPEEAFKEIQANKDEFIPELLASLEYVYQNAEKLYVEKDDYFLHTYAMYLLAEFREQRAFPHLAAWLSMPEKHVDFVIGESLTEDFDRILLSTFSAKHLQTLYDVIENQDLFKWARNAALSAYTLFHVRGFVSREEFISYMRSLIYDKLASEQSDIVNTELIGSIMDARVFEMIPDALFVYENRDVDEMLHGGYDDFIDWIFSDKYKKDKDCIDDALAEIKAWGCFENIDDDVDKGLEDKDSEKDEKKDVDIVGALEGLFGDGIKKDREIEADFARKQAAAQNASMSKKVGRNEPCPCGSGKKYKKCCINATKDVVERPTAVRVEDKYDLLERYPKDSPEFNERYEAEATEIDILVYKALHHRAIPVWVKRDLHQEKLGKIDYLNEALKLFLTKCEREQISSFAVYDERYMVHYRSEEWIASLIDLTVSIESPKVAAVRKVAVETFKRFENIY
ncbi:MAG: DUF1186 domain-containing protein [Oscillospiraceae bacterium]|nr:DUF1186 domain-containing protein [Oscillospiraceae bacterium]